MCRSPDSEETVPINISVGGRFNRLSAEGVEIGRTILPDRSKKVNSEGEQVAAEVDESVE